LVGANGEEHTEKLSQPTLKNGPSLPVLILKRYLIVILHISC